MFDSISCFNLFYIQEIYETYLKKPDAVSKEWQFFFQQHGLSSGDLSHNLQNLEDNSINFIRDKGYLYANFNPLKDNQNQISQKVEIPKNSILEKLKEIYCGSVGVQIDHLNNDYEKQWLQEKIENYKKPLMFSEIEVLKDLMRACKLENFLHNKFPSAKRFSLQGAETLIPFLNYTIKNFTQKEVEEIVIGMAHRGRICVLANVMMQPLLDIFLKFINHDAENNFLHSGDVKYHLGYENKIFISDSTQKELKISLLNNPSHLESINTVLLGKVKARQDLINDKESKKVKGILIHGDASFAGQGIVLETLNLSKISGYSTGGTIHLIINNQIGFTADPKELNSYTYCTDVAKIIEAPIFHINGDDPENALKFCQIACDYNQKFSKDIIIDLVCYRKLGHNETDDPSFTQPQLYEKINNHKGVTEVYKDYLIENKLLKFSDIDLLENDINQLLNNKFEESKNLANLKKAPVKPHNFYQLDLVIKTGIDRQQIMGLVNYLTTLPIQFNSHPKIKKIFENKNIIFNQELIIDFNLAESLAFASLLLEGFNIRFSGQDSIRGTFSQRHAILTDYLNGNKYCHLDGLPEKKGFFQIMNSPLSEAGVLGFEYGYSTVCQKNLTLWEAQFGDFANNAQVIIDQFLASAQTKWGQYSNLVMLLPHGMEGQGPEHSSARLERFLQLSANQNWQIINCTNSANYFHALRRQAIEKVRIPLIIMTPKSLLRNKISFSKVEEIDLDTEFKKIITYKVHQNCKKIFFCSGKIFTDILIYLKENEIDGFSLLAIEQLYPFPYDEINKILGDLENTQIIWVQEEPKNMGAWFFIRDFIEQILAKSNNLYKRISYLGRVDSSSPATGYFNNHVKSQKEIIKKALLIYNGDNTVNSGDLEGVVYEQYNNG